jgi:thiamine-phosphate pyrophosphorylase
MQIILLSNPTRVRKEADTLNELFDRGLTTFHLCKPGYSIGDYREYLLNIEPDFHNRIVVHYHFNLCNEFGLKGLHFGSRFKRDGVIKRLQFSFANFRYRNLQRSKSFFSLKGLKSDPTDYDYKFLTPVFNSMSEKVFRAGFDERRLRNAIVNSNSDIYALGGIDENTILEARKLGFAGAVLVGAIWKTHKPIEAFETIIAASNDESIHREEPKLLRVV